MAVRNESHIDDAAFNANEEYSMTRTDTVVTSSDSTGTEEAGNAETKQGTLGQDVETATSVTGAEDGSDNAVNKSKKIEKGIKNIASSVTSVVATPAAVATKAFKSLAGMMGISSKAVAITISVLGSATVGSFLLGAGNSTTNTFGTVYADCLESTDNLTYNDPYVWPIQEERDDWAHAIWRVLGSREITRLWTNDSSVKEPAGYAGKLHRKWGSAGGGGGSGSGDDPSKFYMLVDKDVDDDGNIIDDSGLFNRGFSIEAAIGFIACADCEGGVRANGYEGNYLVGPETDDGFGGDPDLSKNHHYNWDLYVDALAGAYSKSSNPIAKDAAENMKEGGAYEYTDQNTEEKHKYPGVGLIGFTGAHAYELQEFCDTMATPWDMDGDRHNDAMYTLTGQLLFMIYEDDWLRYVTSTGSGFGICVSNRLNHVSEVKENGEFFKLEVPQGSVSGDFTAIGHPELSNPTTLDEICRSMYLREGQNERWKNSYGSDVNAYSCKEEEKELFNVRLEWEKKVTDIMNPKSVTFLEWGVFNTVNYDYNIWCYYPGDEEIAKKWRIGGNTTGGGSGGTWMYKGVDAMGNNVYEEQVVYSYSGAKPSNIGRINITDLYEGSPVFIDCDSHAYLESSMPRDDKFRRLVGYEEGYMHEWGDRNWYNTRTDGHYRMSIWMWDIRHEVVARDRYGRLLHCVSDDNGSDWQAECENDSGVVGRSWVETGAPSTERAQVSSEKIIRKTLKHQGSGVNNCDSFEVTNWRGSIKKGDWIIVESRSWTEKEFESWYSSWYGGNLESDEGTFKETFRTKGKNHWDNDYTTCGTCANCPKCEHPDPICTCDGCKCIVHHTDCPYGRGDMPCAGCNCQAANGGAGCSLHGVKVCNEGCTSHPTNRWAEAAHECRVKAQSEAVEEAFGRVVPSANPDGLMDRLNQELVWDVWANVTSDDKISAGGFACEVMAEMFYYSLCMAQEGSGQYGRKFDASSQAIKHFVMSSHYWEQYMGTMGKTLSNMEAGFRAAANMYKNESSLAGQYQNPSDLNNAVADAQNAVTAAENAYNAAQSNAQSHWANDPDGSRYQGWQQRYNQAVENYNNNFVGDRTSEAYASGLTNATAGLRAELANEMAANAGSAYGQAADSAMTALQNAQAALSRAQAAQAAQQSINSTAGSVYGRATMAGSSAYASDVSGGQKGLALMREHANLKYFSNRAWEKDKYCFYDDETGVTLLKNDGDQMIYGAGNHPKQVASGYPSSETYGRKYTDHEDYTGNPTMFINRRCWYANDNLSELMMSQWNPLESYPFSKNTMGGGAGDSEHYVSGTVTEYSYHSNYKVRAYVYPETGRPRCGTRLELDNMASTALWLSWPQGHMELATVNSLRAEPDGSSSYDGTSGSGGGSSGDKDLAAKLCTEAYVKVKDLVLNNGEVFYSSCDRGAMTVARASGADPLFYWTDPAKQMAYMEYSDMWMDVLNNKVVYEKAIDPTSPEAKDKEGKDLLVLPSRSIQTAVDMFDLQPGDILVSPGQEAGGTTDKHIMIFVGSRVFNEKMNYRDVDYIFLRYPGLYNEFLSTPSELAAKSSYAFALVHSSNANFGDVVSNGLYYARGLMTQIFPSSDNLNDTAVGAANTALEQCKGYYVFRCLNRDSDSMGPKWLVNSHWSELANTPSGVLKDTAYQMQAKAIADWRAGYFDEE